jgi:hypothetical protein
MNNTDAGNDEQDRAGNNSEQERRSEDSGSNDWRTVGVTTGGDQLEQRAYQTKISTTTTRPRCPYSSVLHQAAHASAGGFAAGSAGGRSLTF